jgi:hypothetical protein
MSEAKYTIGIDKGSDDGSIEVITKYRNDEIVHSVDGGKTYHASVKLAIRAYERELAKKEMGKVVQKYCEPQTLRILDARNAVVRAGGRPNVMYIGDIFPPKKNELPLSPMQMNTGCKIFGMKIIADYRVPRDHFYIMQGEL